jgi:hypothetical protein
MADQGIEVFVFGDNVDVSVRIDLLPLTDVVRKDQIRSILATTTCLHQLDLVGILEKFPHQRDGKFLVLLAEDEGDFDRLLRNAIQIGLMNIFKIHENVVHPRWKIIAHARQKSRKFQ